jgi:hypothetical protein
MINFRSDLELDIVGSSQIASRLEEREGDTTSLRFVACDDKSRVLRATRGRAAVRAYGETGTIVVTTYDQPIALRLSVLMLKLSEYPTRPLSRVHQYRLSAQSRLYSRMGFTTA